ncbi:MAG: glycosyltransferase family 4 protein [Candidatus Margulisiibacteriota bacterium]
MTPLKLNILAESFIGKANGVYTAFVEAVENLKKEPSIDLTINGKGHDFDVIHSHTIGLSYIRYALGRRKKMIVSAHVVPDSFIGSLIFSTLWQPLAALYLKWVYNLSGMVIAVSPVVKTELEKLGVRGRIEVLCNSVNRDKFKVNVLLRKQFREKWGLQDKDFVAVCVGQIQPRKGVEDFIKTAKQCPDIRFVWVGGRPYGRLTADYATMTDLVDNAPANVIFTDAVEFEDMPGFYAMSDVYFFPSYQENFAFATIEASAVKLPLVLRDNPEYPSSLFTHYLKAQGPDGFANCLQKLHLDPAFFQKWRRESDLLAQQYEIKTYMKRLIQFYRDVAGH